MRQFNPILLLLFLFCFVNGLFAQQTIITLEDAIRLARENSFEFKTAQNRLQRSQWDFQNYKVSLLPNLALDGSLPNYMRSISKITLPSGEDTFVTQNQAYSSLNLGVFQPVVLTGGSIWAGTNLNRIDVFGKNRRIFYSSTPLSLSYSHDAIGFNKYKWRNKIELLVFESSKRKYVQDLEGISSETVRYFFNALSTDIRLKLSQQNLAAADTLYRIAQDRFKLGNVSKSELLQLRLSILKARKQLSQDSVDHLLAHQQLSRYLVVEEEIIPVFSESVSFFHIDYKSAIGLANENSVFVLESRVKRLEAERNIAEVKSQTGLKFNVKANIGFTSSSDKFSHLADHFENQQQVSLGFSIPIMDWGLGRTQRQSAEANLNIVNEEIKQVKMQAEQEITLYINRWNLHRQQLQIVKESRDIAMQNYILEMERLKRGSIGINDFNIAGEQKDNATIAYFDSIKQYWELYFIIRKLTLYDFEKNRPL